MSATISGNSQWFNAVDLEGRYEELMSLHHDQIIGIAEVLINYAKKRDLEALLWFTMALQKAVDTATSIIEEEQDVKAKAS